MHMPTSCMQHGCIGQITRLPSSPWSCLRHGSFSCAERHCRSCDHRRPPKKGLASKAAALVLFRPSRALASRLLLLLRSLTRLLQLLPLRSLTRLLLLPVRRPLLRLLPPRLQGFLLPRLVKCRRWHHPPTAHRHCRGAHRLFQTQTMTAALTTMKILASPCPTCLRSLPSRSPRRPQLLQLLLQLRSLTRLHL